MNNKLFGKATALVIGSLVLFSSQALAISSNKNQELINAEAFGESELLIAQASKALTPQEKDDLAKAVAAASAESVFGPAIAAANALAIPGVPKDAIAGAFSQAQSIFGPALARSAAVAATKGDAQAIAQAFSQAESVLGPAFAQSKALAQSGPTGSALAQAAANAESVFGPAAATAQAVAR